jgi:hypothetical protein
MAAAAVRSRAIGRGQAHVVLTDFAGLHHV